MITFQEEPFSRVLPEMQALFQEHYDEVAEDKNVVGEFDIDYPKYFLLEKGGSLHTLTVRYDGKLIGYYVALVGPLLRYKTIIHSTDDVHFIHRQYRKHPRIALRLFLEAEKMIKQHGAILNSVRVKVAHDHSRLLEYLGYRLAEKNYVKVL